MRRLVRLATQTQGSAVLEFAIAVPLLVVFVVGIYDFSGAYNQKQKIEHAAQAGAIVAGGQPTGDMDPAISDPESLRPVLNVIMNSLAADGVLPLANQGNCAVPVPPTAVSNSALAWTYTITDCSANPADNLIIVIDRGVVVTGPPLPPTVFTVSTSVTVSFPYHWRFNSAIQLLFPGAAYLPVTDVHETATVHNQM